MQGCCTPCCEPVGAARGHHEQPGERRGECAPGSGAQAAAVGEPLREGRGGGGPRRWARCSSRARK
eukprot:12893236-Alexandrium_andersonii.AAC.1